MPGLAVNLPAVATQRGRVSAGRRDAEDPAVGAVGQEVDETVRALAHVADALLQVGEVSLFPRDAVRSPS